MKSQVAGSLKLISQKRTDFGRCRESSSQNNGLERRYQVKPVHLVEKRLSKRRVGDSLEARPINVPNAALRDISQALARRSQEAQ